MENTIKIKGIFVDVENQKIEVKVINYCNNSYADFKKVLRCYNLSSCKRPIPFMNDVIIIHDDLGFYKEKVQPSYILHKDEEIVSMIPGNIFICGEEINIIEGDKLCSLTNNEIELILTNVVELENDEKKKYAICVNINDLDVL